MKRLYYSTLLTLVLLSGCAPRGLQLTPNATEVLSPSPTLSTPTSSPTLTPVPSETLTPQPTLEPAQAEEAIRTLLREPVDCSAPCFWGIKPGETTIDEARQIASHLGLPFQFTLEQDGSRFFAITHDAEVAPSTHIILATEEGIVQTVTASIVPGQQEAGAPREWLAYSPATLIARYGAPSRVNFFADWGQLPAYAMALYFDEVHLIADYGGYGIIGGTPSAPQICPLTDRFDSVRLWMGKEPVHPPNRDVPLERAVSMTVEQFTDLMMGAPEEACLTLNRKYFP